MKVIRSEEMIDNWIHYLQLAYIAVINCAGEMAIIVHSGWFVSFTQTHKSQIANCKMPLCVLCYAKGTLFSTHFRSLKVNFIRIVSEVAGGGEVSTQHCTIMYSPLTTLPINAVRACNDIDYLQLHFRLYIIVYHSYCFRLLIIMTVSDNVSCCRKPMI